MHSIETDSESERPFMRQVIFRSWEPIRVLARRWNTLPGSVLSLLTLLLQRKIARRRLAIVAAAVLVFAYAGGVLSYVMLTPDIGVRCAFTPVVNHFNRDFLFASASANAAAPEGDDEIVADRRPKTFPTGRKFFMSWSTSRRNRGEPADEGRPRPPMRETHLLVDGQEIIRVGYRRPADDAETARMRYGSASAGRRTRRWFRLSCGFC